MMTLAEAGLVRDVRRYGTFDANACLNCGTCTIVCDLSNGHASFPRRPLQRVILGLRSSVHKSLEPWLCHDCGDCSIACPRRTEPRDSIMTLRRYLASQYDFTGISSKILVSKTWEIAALIITGLLVLALAALYHIYEVDVYREMPLGDFLSTGMGLGHMFDTIIYFTVAVYCIPLLIMLVNAFRMYRFTMCAEGEPRPPLRLYFAEFWTILEHMVTHKNIGKCVQSAHKPRWIKHWWLGFGFVLISVILIFFLEWFQTDEIYPLYHPQRWLGYLATIGLTVGSIDILISRARKQKEIHKASEFSDWILPALLLATAVSGIAVHIFRYMDLPLLCHYTYALHLAIATPMLVIELPFGKLAHAVYRPMALYFQAVRERALAQEPVTDQPISKEPVIA